MYKYVLVFSILFLFIFPVDNQAQPSINCPNVSDLQQTSLNSKKELIQALEEIVPDTYEQGEYAERYSEWRLITALPFQQTIGRATDEIYYKMAENFCGKQVADRSWLVRLYFPKWEGESASALAGQIFVAKSKEKGWFVWFRYH